MSITKYVPQVGDTVRRDIWTDPCLSVKVTAVGRNRFLAINAEDDELSYPTHLDWVWVKVETPAPLPDRWINVHPRGLGATYPPTQASANFGALPGRIAVLHIWTDADGVDHADIERLTS